MAIMTLCFCVYNIIKFNMSVRRQKRYLKKKRKTLNIRKLKKFRKGLEHVKIKNNSDGIFIHGVDVFIGGYLVGFISHYSVENFDYRMFQTIQEKYKDVYFSEFMDKHNKKRIKKLTKRFIKLK